MNALARIAVNPPVVIPLEKILLMISGILLRMPGTSSTLIPREKLMAKTRIALRSIFVEAIILIPDAATVPNIKRVAPPRTQLGIMEKNSPTIGNNPRIKRKAAMIYPI